METVKVIKLKFPITDGDKVISELKFRQAELIDMQDLPLNPADWKWLHFLPIAVRLTGEMTHVLTQLKPIDGVEVMGFLGEHLLGGSPETGASPLPS